MPDDEIEVDARGLYCPLPVLRLARALRRQPEGRVALLLATDPVSVQDVEVFCAEQGCTLLESSRDGEVFVFRVRKGVLSVRTVSAAARSRRTR
jgi:tRNA 2-thiouridine synthesizing protein A